MRLIVLDTETTGLNPAGGDRMVEIGAVTIEHRTIRRDRTFHHYINPGRPIPQEVVRIHGIDDRKVANEPRFPALAEEFLAFIAGATLVIHNAPFDLGFITHELQLAGLPGIHTMPVIDTLTFARERHPNQRNNLDALCDRYGIERGHRTRHGALLDAELLAELYLAMTGGRQFSLGTELHSRPVSALVQLPQASSVRDERSETAPLVRRASLAVPEHDTYAHQAMLERIHKESGGKTIWHQPAL